VVQDYAPQANASGRKIKTPIARWYSQGWERFEGIKFSGNHGSASTVQW
jgi:hypothetical protein